MTNIAKVFNNTSIKCRNAMVTVNKMLHYNEQMNEWSNYLLWNAEQWVKGVDFRFGHAN